MMTQTNEKLPMIPNDDFLCHHGEKGQKWGVRRYQNPDGSLTPLGRRHWGIGPPREKSDRKSFRLETAEERKERLELKARKKAEKAERKAEKNRAAMAKKKIALINEGDRDKIYKNRKLFTDEELAYADRRISAAEKFKADPKELRLSAGQMRRKERLLMNGSLNDIKKHSNLFTTDELKNIQARADLLSKMDPDAKKANEKADKGGLTVDKILDGAGKLTKIATTAVSLYQGYNKVAGAVNEITGKDTMKTFDLNPWSKKDSDKEKDNKGNKNDNKTPKWNLGSFDDKWDTETTSSSGYRGGSPGNYYKTGFNSDRPTYNKGDIDFSFGKKESAKSIFEVNTNSDAVSDAFSKILSSGSKYSSDVVDFA